MPKGMTSVELTDTAAFAWLSNHVKHAMVKPRVLFDLGSAINADGLTTRWTTVKQHKDAIEELLVLTQGRVPKHAKLLKQFIAWCGTHGVTWSWKDSDRAMQHLRAMLRSLQSYSLPPGKAPKNYDDLQLLIDKFIEARNEDHDDVALIPTQSSPTVQLDVRSDDETPRPNKRKQLKIDIPKREPESDSEPEGLFRKKIDAVPVLPRCFSAFPQ